MATGVSKTAKPYVGQVEESLPSTAPVLCYDGKASTAEILSGEAPELVRVATFGQQPSGQLIWGENGAVLRTLLQDPAVRGQVRLVYIDPPYATDGVFETRTQAHAYSDTLTGSAYIEFLRRRLVLLRELLALDGSIYVHLDETMVFHAKLIMDEVFGPENYRNCITRKKCNPKNYTRKTFGNIADYILFYTKSDTYVWNRAFDPWTDERAREYQYVDEESGRRFMKVPVHAPGTRHGATGGLWRGKSPPPGKHWQYPPDRLDEMDARGEIYWSSNGNPRRKVYLDESPGVPVQDIWMDFKDAHNQNIRVSGYPTEKNANLLRRIVLASSNPGDMVLDCFAGSGTTLGVASELDRKWIGVDRGEEALRATVRRLLFGTEPMGDFVGVRGKNSSATKDTDGQGMFTFAAPSIPPVSKVLPERDFAHEKTFSRTSFNVDSTLVCRPGADRILREFLDATRRNGTCR